jgi:hypothetical protein
MQPGVKWHPGSLPKSARCLTDSIQTFHNFIAMDLLPSIAGFYVFFPNVIEGYVNWMVVNLEQMSSMAQLKNMELLKSQGLVGSNWADAQDGRTFPVCLNLNTHFSIWPLHTLPFFFWDLRFNVLCLLGFSLLWRVLSFEQWLYFCNLSYGYG